LSLTKKIAQDTITKIYDMAGNSVNVDEVFLEQMEATLQSIMDTTGYTEDSILELARSLNEDPDFAAHCVKMRRATFKVVR